MIFDTDVLIWYLRGNKKATDLVVKSVPFSISIVTYMELVQGMKNKQELEEMRHSLKTMDISIVPIYEDVSILASRYVEDFYLSNSMKLDDALIASTCVMAKEPLITANDKHFKAIKDLDIKVFRP